MDTYLLVDAWERLFFLCNTVLKDILVSSISMQIAFIILKMSKELV